MSNDFQDEIPTQPIITLTEEDTPWDVLIRQRATTRNLREQAEKATQAAKIARELQWIRTIKE